MSPTGPQWPVGSGTERLRSDKMENLGKDPQAKWKTTKRIRQKGKGQKGSPGKNPSCTGSIFGWDHAVILPISGMTLWITWEILLHSGTTSWSNSSICDPPNPHPAGTNSFPLQFSCILSMPQPFLGRGFCAGAPPQQEDGAVGSWSVALIFSLLMVSSSTRASS